MTLIDRYIGYVRDIRRYSPKTVAVYEDVLRQYLRVTFDSDEVTDKEIVASMNHSEIRSYEVWLLESDPPKSARTVSLHLSALSGFCRYLMKEGFLKSNPVRLVAKPKQEKRLPHFIRDTALSEYLNNTSHLFDEEEMRMFCESWDTPLGKKCYKDILAALIVRILYSSGLRRSELVGLCISDVDFGRNVVKVRGKGDKMREIPLIDSLSEEILLYLKAVETMCGRNRSLTEPLLVTYKGSRIYPEYVNRAVKGGLEGYKDMPGRKSPHVLRHSLATELLDNGTDLNSIKELLGHSSLAATQVYTHSTIARLKSIYEQAHPRAKNGGKHGD